MRVIDIISEATLQRSSTTSWPDYLKNLLTAKDIGVGPQGEKLGGQHLDSNSKELIKSLIEQFASADNKIQFARQIEEIIVTLLPSKQQVPLKYLHKSTGIKGSAAESGKEKKPWNEGEVAETILGAALYARFFSKKKVKPDDVWSALKMFANNVIPGGFEIAGTKRNKQSPITMRAINKPLNNLIIDKLVHNKAELQKQYPEGVEALENKVIACAEYVNESNKILQALAEADANPGAPINIKTDGVGDQKGTKADLQIDIGNWQQLLSLKVNDVKQFGQDSGSSGTVITTFFQRFIPDLDLSDLYMRDGEPIPWTPESGEGWPDTDNKKSVKQLKIDGLWDAAIDQIYKLTGMAYQKAAAHLQDKLTTPEGSAEVITNLYQGIMHHAQGNSQFQTLVILNPDSKTAWKELEFGPSLEQALGNYKIEVAVEIASARGAGNHRLRVYGKAITPEAVVASQSKIDNEADAKKAKKKIDSGQVPTSSSNEMLFQLRSYFQESGNMRNPVEMGSLLKNITEVQKIEDLPDLSTTEKPAPVASTPIAPAVNKPVALKKQAIPPVDTTPVDTTANASPTTTTLQGSEFTAPPPLRQAGMPAKEEPAMMEQKIIHLKF
jgi:hypothetical protein